MTILALDMTAIGSDKLTSMAVLSRMAALSRPSGLAADKLLIRDNMKSAIRSPKLKIWRFVLQDPRALRRSETCFGKPVGPAPQRQNNGARASDGASLPWLSRKLRPEPCFGKPDGRQNNGARACDGAGLPRLSASKIPPLCIARKLVSGSPSGHPPTPKRRKQARGRLSQKLWPSPGKLFREARRASPQRQNNGACACDGAGLPWLSRKLRPSPGKLFREARRASSQRQNYESERERRAPSEAVAEASAVLGKPDEPDPSVKTTGTSFRAARRARPKPKPSTSLRVAKNDATRPGRVSANPKP